MNRREYDAQYYQKNKDRIKTRVAANQPNLRRRNRDFVNGYKVGAGCIICGFNEAPEALDFHHVGKKETSIAELANTAHSIASIRREMDGCVVICSNHHRMLHAGKITLPE